MPDHARHDALISVSLHDGAVGENRIHQAASLLIDSKRAMYLVAAGAFGFIECMVRPCNHLICRLIIVADAGNPDAHGNHQRLIVELTSAALYLAADALRQFMGGGRGGLR